MTKLIQKNNRIFTGKRLFQFSLSCKPVPITRHIKFLPKDLKHDKYAFTGFYVSDLLDQRYLNSKNPMFHLLKGSILTTNQIKINRYDHEQTKDFINKKPLYLKQYINKYGKSSYHYFIYFYAREPFKTFKNSVKYQQALNRLRFYFC